MTVAQIQALQFEWAWQHPEKSLAVREAALRLGARGMRGPAGKVSLPLQDQTGYTCSALTASYEGRCEAALELPDRHCHSVAGKLVQPLLLTELLMVTSRSLVHTQVRLLTEMLRGDPWMHFPLTVHFTSSAHAKLRAGCPALPDHMLVDIAPLQVPRSIHGKHCRVHRKMTHRACCLFVCA